MLLQRLLAFSSILGLATSVSFTVVAPKQMRWGVREKVAVVNHETSTRSIIVCVNDFPEKRKNIICQTKSVPGPSAATFELTVNLDAHPDADRLDITDDNYVFVTATASGVTEDSQVLMSSNIANVYIQTDKPLYTPGQLVKVNVFTTDLENKPITIPIRLQLISPSDLVVNEIDRQTLYFDDTLNRNRTGMYRHEFAMYTKPSKGHWSIGVSYGPKLNGVIQYAAKKTVKFELSDYVLPRFSCKISNLRDFIYKTQTTPVAVTVSARYTYGEAVQGSVMIMYGVMDNNYKMQLRKFSDELTNGELSYDINLANLYTTYQGNNFNFGTHVEGKKFFVEARCTEKATGKTMEDFSSKTLFVETPYKFNFDKTVSHFKPGLPFFVQFQVMYKNGLPAIHRRVQISATGRPGNRNLGNAAKKSDKYGRVSIRFSSFDDLQTVKVNFKVRYEENGDFIDHEDSITLKAFASDKDFSIRIDDAFPLSIGEGHEVSIEPKNFGMTQYSMFVISQGRIIESRTDKFDRTENSVTFHLNPTYAMAPSARLVVFSPVDGQRLAAASLWLDVQNNCSTQMEVYTRDDDGAKETFNPGYGSASIWANVRWEPEAYVALQMVDTAVLVLNDKTTLTAESMWKQLEAMDTGCGGGGGSTTANIFHRTGLSVSSTYKDIITGNKLSSSYTCPKAPTTKRRKRRSVTLDTSTCCERGTQIDTQQTWERCEQLYLQFSIEMMESNELDFECLKIIKECCRNTSLAPLMAEGPERSGSGSDEESIELDLAGQVRAYFPESVFIGTTDLSQNGYGTKQFDLPDTVTTWSVEAVGLHENEGMCVAKPYEFSVKKNHFIDVSMPRYAVRGEQLNVMVTFYNFGDSFTEVTLYMKGIDSVCSTVRDGAWDASPRLEVDRHSAKSYVWKIVPLEEGRPVISFAAMYTRRRAADAVDKAIIILPEGKEKLATLSSPINPQSDDTEMPEGVTCQSLGEKKRCNFQILLPKNQIVEGTVHGRIRVTAIPFPDPETVIMNGVENKLRMPWGCGEQIMLSVGPSVYAYLYVREVHGTNLKLANKLKDILASGMMKLQDKKKGSGGFGVWSWSPAKTWLTAFIVKVFNKGHSLVGSVDTRTLTNAVNYIFTQQRNGQFFDEMNSVARHHHEMIGAISLHDLTFTAYVTAALAESQLLTQQQEDQLASSFIYLGDRVTNSKSNYERALVAYALSFYNSNKKNIAYGMLKNKATSSNGGIYFPGGNKRIRVETASYAVLTALRHDDLDFAKKLVAWLNTQRTVGGVMFSSTQDTVMALQALTLYGIAADQQETQLTVALNNLDTTEYHSASQRHQFDDQTKNKEIVRELDPAILRDSMPIDIEVEGKGEAQVTLEVFYNVEGAGDDDDDKAFNVNVVAEFPEAHRKRKRRDLPFGDLPGGGGGGGGGDRAEMTITVEAKYNKKSTSNMAIIEVGLITGYEASNESLSELKTERKISDYEISDAKVIMYLEAIKRDEKTSVTFTALRDFEAENLAPAIITVYDYYNPDHITETFYPDVNSKEFFLPIERDEGTFTCLQGRCAPFASNNIVHTEKVFKQKKCSPTARNSRINYVYKVKHEGGNTIVGGDGSVWNEFTLKVESVYLKGSNDVVPGTYITVRERKLCEPLELKYEDTSVFFMYGKDEHKETRANQEVFVYTANSDTFFVHFNQSALRNYIKAAKRSCRS